MNVTRISAEIVTMDDGSMWLKTSPTTMVLLPAETASLLVQVEEVPTPAVPAAQRRTEVVSAVLAGKQEASIADVRTWLLAQPRFKGQVKDRGRISAGMLRTYTTATGNTVGKEN